MIELSKQQLWDLLDDESTKEVKHEPWRHGTRTTYLLQIEGVPHIVELDTIPEEGIQVYGATKAYKAKEVTTTTWVKAE